MVNVQKTSQMCEKPTIKSVTIKFGGSVLYNDNQKIDVDLIRRYREIINLMLSRGIKVCLVVGGGITSRNFVNQLRNFVKNKTSLDLLSIKITQMHAAIVRMLIGDIADAREFNHYDNLTQYNWDISQVPVLGGLYPGQSTNGTAALAAEILDSDLLINCFGYDHIKSLDPTKSDIGEKLDQISYQGLSSLIDKHKQEPGHYELFDKIALNIVRRSFIPVLFINGRKPNQIMAYMDGKTIGTMVRD